MGSVGNTTVSTADYSQGYTNATSTLRSQYRNAQELRDAGFKAVNDFSLDSLLRDGNEVASDNQPWNNKVVYFIWDSDFKQWVKAAERSY